MNQRPPAPKAGTLAKLSHAPTLFKFAEYVDYVFTKTKLNIKQEKIFQENKKLRAVMNTTWSKDWPNEVSKIFKESKDDKTKT